MRSLTILLAASLPAIALAAPTLTLEGSCPGVADITISDITPGANLAFLATNLGVGDDAIPVGRCAGTQTGLTGPRWLFTVPDGDLDGTIALSPTLGDFLCDRHIQMLDTESCTLTDIGQLSDMSVVEPPVDCVDDGGGFTAGDLVGAMPATWEGVITSPHAITYDGGPDYISDGGGDMYDGGNRLQPYGDGVALSYSAGALIESNAYVDYITEERSYGQLAVFTAKSDINMGDIGNLGSDGGGTFETWSSTSGAWTAEGTTTCLAGDPSVNVMWVYPTSEAGISFDAQTNTFDNDNYLNGIPAGTTFFHLLWAETSGRCPTADDKQAILDAIVGDLPAGGDCDDGGGGASDAPHLSEPFVGESDGTWWCSGTGLTYTNYGYLTFDECQDIANRTGTNWYGGVSSPIVGAFWIGEDGPDTAVIGSDGYWTDEIVVPRGESYQCVLGMYDRRSDPSEFPEEQLYVDGEGRTWHYWYFTAQTHAQAMAWASDVGGRIINPNSVGLVGTPAYTIPTHQCHAGAEFNGGGTCNSDNICNFYVGFFE